MPDVTLEKLIAAIRAGADNAALSRLIGPTPEELAEHERRLARADSFWTKGENMDDWPDWKRAVYARLDREITIFENRYF